jgi:PleD family two-component response regulator
MAAVRDTPVLVGTDNIHYTISSGLSTKTPTTISFDDLLKQSDQALYQAKSAGRDQVFVYGQTAESFNVNDTSSSRL